MSAEHPARQVAACWFRAASEEPSATSARGRLEELARRGEFAGWANYYLGRLSPDHVEAAKRFRRAAEAFAAKGDVEAEIHARNRLFFVQSDDADEAARQAHRLQELASVPGAGPEIEAWAELFTARALFLQAADLEAAISRYERVTRHAAATPLAQREAWVGIANGSIELGRFEAARAAFAQARELSRAPGQQDGDGEASAEYGLVRVAIEELDESPSADRRARLVALASAGAREARRQGRARLERKYLLVLGAVAGPGDLPAIFERCLELAAAPQERSQCRLGWARRLATSRPTQARQWIEEDLRDTAPPADALIEAQLWQSRSRVLWQTSGPVEALAGTEQALAAIENLRERHLNAASRAEWFSTWSDSYLWASGQLLKQHRAGEPRVLEQAFDLAERRRARVLTERVAGRGQRGPTASLAEVRRRLAGDQALLAFQMAPDVDWSGELGGGSWLVVITREAVRAQRLPERGTLRRMVRVARAKLAARDGSEREVLRVLGEALFSEAIAGLPANVRRLLIVPDDSLSMLPFAALPVDRTSGEPLGARYEISLAPSATLWLSWQARPAAGRVRWVALAAPRLPAESGPFSMQNAGGLVPLRRARAEVERVAATLDQTEVRFGDEASEGWLRRMSWHDVALLHLASHARSVEAQPERSAIYLASDDAREDGRLEPAEIAALRLDGTVVVLSACDTAAGPVLRGEGALSLVRAFHAAGSPAVIASAAALEDGEAERLVVELYRGLTRGESLAAALRAAQLARRRSGAPTADWAGLAVWGDGDRAVWANSEHPLQPRRLAGVAFVLLATLVALAAALARRRRAPSCFRVTPR